MGMHNSFFLDDIFWWEIPGSIEEKGGWGPLWEEKACFQGFIEDNLCFISISSLV